MSLTRLQALLGVLLGALLFVAVVLLGERFLAGYRLDLTADDLYSITEETQAVLDEVEEPITLTFYFSYDAAQGVPYVREYARRVEELLESYVARSDGEIRLRRVDPQPLTEAGERAEELGLEPVPAGDGKEIYLGLSGTNQVDDLEVIKFFEPEREPFLEYDLTNLIARLNRPDPPRVGLLTRLPMTSGVNPGTGQERPDWAVIDRIEEVAEIEEIRAPIEHIDEEKYDLLIVNHPLRLNDPSYYAIDQYLMRGGQVMMFADPVADSVSGMREQDGEIEKRISTSQPGPLLESWGIEIGLDRALADPRSGMVVTGSEGGRDIHPGLIRIEGDGIADDDPITAMIEQVTVGSPGTLQATDDGPVMEPLLRSAESAAPVAVENFVGFERPWEILQGYQPDGQSHVVAARFSGAIASAYGSEAPAALEEGAELHRGSTEEGHVVVFADTDMLTDQMWTRPTPDQRRGARETLADNGELVANAVENLVGGRSLAELRGRGTSARPFTRVEALERAATERHQEERAELRDELDAVEEEIESLRAGGETGETILSSEQRAELEDARERRRALRSDLRQLQQRLDAEVEALGNRLKFLNIVVVPLGIAGAALVVFGIRRRRQRRHRRASA